MTLDTHALPSLSIRNLECHGCECAAEIYGRFKLRLLTFYFLTKEELLACGGQMIPHYVLLSLKILHSYQVQPSILNTNGGSGNCSVTPSCTHVDQHKLIIHPHLLHI